MRHFFAVIFCGLLAACAGHTQTANLGYGETIAVGPTRAITSNSAFVGHPVMGDVRTTGRAINDLAAYRAFKQNHPELFYAGAARGISLDAVQAINTQVNQAIQYQDDAPGVEIWRVQAGGGYGNCHDYAVTKLAKMVAAGAPRSALRLTVASVKATGEWHLMLAVDMPGRGTLFMDSNRQDVLTAAEAKALYNLWFMENPMAQRLELVG